MARVIYNRLHEHRTLVRLDSLDRREVATQAPTVPSATPWNTYMAQLPGRRFSPLGAAAPPSIQYLATGCASPTIDRHDAVPPGDYQRASPQNANKHNGVLDSAMSEGPKAGVLASPNRASLSPLRRSVRSPGAAGFPDD